MGLGALLALLVLFVFGTTPKTDGLFTAYGVYGVLLMLAQSLRTTIVARLVEAPRCGKRSTATWAPSLALALAAAVPLVVLADPLAHLLTGHATGEAHDAARTGLWLFALAGAAQLLAAIGAAALGALDRFVAVSVAYLSAGVASIAGVAVLAGRSTLTPSPSPSPRARCSTRSLMARSLLAAGWRPHAPLLRWATELGRRVWIIVSGAAPYAASQAMFVVSVALAARMGSGDATVYTYAFFAASFIVGASSGSVGIVLAAPLAQTWDRSPASLTPHLLTIVALGATLTVPVLGIAAIAGPDLAGVVFGSQLTTSDANAFAGCFVALGGFVLAMLAITVPLLAAFALSRYQAVAGVAVATLVAHVGLEHRRRDHRPPRDAGHRSVGLHRAHARRASRRRLRIPRWNAPARRGRGDRASSGGGRRRLRTGRVPRARGIRASGRHRAGRGRNSSVSGPPARAAARPVGAHPTPPRPAGRRSAVGATAKSEPLTDVNEARAWIVAPHGVPAVSWAAAHLPPRRLGATSRSPATRAQRKPASIPRHAQASARPRQRARARRRRPTLASSGAQTRARTNTWRWSTAGAKAGVASTWRRGVGTTSYARPRRLECAGG